GIRDFHVTGVQTCALPIYRAAPARGRPRGHALAARERLSRGAFYRTTGRITGLPPGDCFVATGGEVMQFPPGDDIADALRDALESGTRRIYLRVEFDWNRDGNFDHLYSDLSPIVQSVSDDRQVTGDLGRA